MSCGAESVAEGIGHLVASALKTRKRYGGSYLWVPREPQVHVVVTAQDLATPVMEELVERVRELKPHVGE
jgi:hypothetical protein